MAVVIRYINTASTAGGDGTTNNITGATRAYASASEWEAAEQTDLVADGDSHIVYVDGSGGNDTTLCAISGWTTDATRTITMEAVGNARNNGVSKDNTSSNTEQYKIKTASGNVFRFAEDFITTIGFELEGSVDPPTRLYAGTGVEVHTLEDMMLCHSGGGASDYTIASNGATINSVVITNCLFISNSRGADLRSLNCTMDHCGSYVDGSLGLLPDSTSNITNTWAMGATSEDFWTGGSAPSGSNNASADSTATTDFTSSLINLTDTAELTSPSTTLTTFDFTLKSGSNLIDAGTGSLTTDISDTSRSGTVDIGPWEFISAGTTTIARHLIQAYKRING